jgi:hypothetical protein
MKAAWKFALVGGAALAALASVFLGTSVAASAAEPADGSLLDLFSPVKDAFAEGRYAYAGSLALVLGVAVARRYGGARFPWLHTKQGSAALVMLGSFAATMSARLATAGATFAPSMLWDAFCVGAGAAGGYAALKALVVDPYLAPLAERYPRAGAPLKMILWVFEGAPDEPTPPAAPAA